MDVSHEVLDKDSVEYESRRGRASAFAGAIAAFRDVAKAADTAAVIVIRGAKLSSVAAAVRRAATELDVTYSLRHVKGSTKESPVFGLSFVRTGRETRKKAAPAASAGADAAPKKTKKKAK